MVTLLTARHGDRVGAGPAANPCCGSQTHLLSPRFLFKLLHTTTTRATSIHIIATNSEINPLCMLQILSLSPSYTAPSSFTQKINSVCGKAGEAAGFSQDSSDSA